MSNRARRFLLILLSAIFVLAIVACDRSESSAEAPDAADAEAPEAADAAEEAPAAAAEAAAEAPAALPEGLDMPPAPELPEIEAQSALDADGNFVFAGNWAVDVRAIMESMPEPEDEMQAAMQAMMMQAMAFTFEFREGGELHISGTGPDGQQMSEHAGSWELVSQTDESVTVRMIPAEEAAAEGMESEEIEFAIIDDATGLRAERDGDVLVLRRI